VFDGKASEIHSGVQTRSGPSGPAGKSVSVVARELGIPRNRLYKWASEAERLGRSAFGGSGRRPDAEVERLRREVERLKEENEILKKKAAAYFAKGLQ
jgi:transposase